MPDPITLLKQDHREVEQMLKTLAQSKPSATRKRTLDKLEAALGLHMHIEEAEVYPLVRGLIGNEDADEANIEHTLAREGLAKMRELVAAPGFGAAVAMVTAGIKHHVKEEEQEMFPELKTNLDRAQLIALGDTVAAKKKAPKPRSARSASRPDHSSEAQPLLARGTA